MQAASRIRIVWTLTGEKKMPPEEDVNTKTETRDNNKEQRTQPAALKARNTQSAEEITEKHRYFRLTVFALMSPITGKLQIPLHISDVFLQQYSEKSSRYFRICTVVVPYGGGPR